MTLSFLEVVRHNLFLDMLIIVLSFGINYAVRRQVEYACLAVIPTFILLIVDKLLPEQFQLIEQDFYALVALSIVLGIIQNIIFYIFFNNRNKRAYRLSWWINVIFLAYVTLQVEKYTANTVVNSVIASITLLMGIVVQHFCFFQATLVRIRKGLAPIKAKKLALSIYYFFIFGCGCLVLTIYIFFLRWNRKLSLSDKRLYVNKLISKLLGKLYTDISYIEMSVSYAQNLNTQRPTILVANHNSFLDTFVVSGLSGQVIFMVNQWVYNTPFFGKVIKYVGYIPTTSSYEDNEIQIRQRFEEGFQLLVFPEGTRSKTNKLNRFHKGAFALAQSLQADIVPLFIHGHAELLPKSDFVIDYNYKTNITIGERILYESFKDTPVSTLTKQISSSFRSNFQKLRTQYEDAHYFDEKLKDSYNYWSKRLQQYIAWDLQYRAEIFYLILDWIQSDKSIALAVDDWGLWSYYFKMRNATQKVIAILPDENQQFIANDNYLNQRYPIEIVGTDKEISTVIDTYIVDVQQITELSTNYRQIILLNYDGVQLPHYQLVHQTPYFKIFRKLDEAIPGI